ncbi:hypothetical protein EV04_0045 [Prochlorococcus marinus str. LG]|uniref:hypothetical protein n=1 Tax=Prochlorococcus marinus TaxID=1219 RepID=UPI0002F453B7|nr:hypothetical protein [Prochlorococcus marinus]KGG14468.1 hypothetical protein EV04_0045 [Prochlorococcus marinus str. LG]KGG24385.1 hypothetical protein EV09_0292 [Prochlorococcus marinus str. SS35]
MPVLDRFKSIETYNILLKIKMVKAKETIGLKYHFFLIEHLAENSVAFLRTSIFTQVIKKKSE